MISVIIPAYNEENRISSTLSDLILFIKENNLDMEVIVVNDGSTDKTVEVVSLFMDRLNLKVINIGRNRGKGYAVKQGVLNASGDMIIFFDADGATKIIEINNLINKITEGYDIVIGSREESGARIIKKQSPLRLFLKRPFNYFLRIIFGISDLKDTQCGFKGFKGNIARRIFSEVTTNGFAFDVEVLVIGLNMGYRVFQLPVIWENKKESSVNFVSIFVMMIDLLKIKYNSLMKKY
ncbi:MAG: glycosyltransferase family 2 protein [Candidatus Pacebacteria bacterium]|nr:glycosyltransferase family 2 protein [Candidatus Paceibacterota bacterium]